MHLYVYWRGLFSDSESDGEADYPDVDDDRDFEPDNFYENIEIDEEDEKALEMFMSSNPQKTRNLADIIMDKINEKQTELRTQFSEAGEMQLQEIDPRFDQSTNYVIFNL